MSKGNLLFLNVSKAVNVIEEGILALDKESTFLYVKEEGNKNIFIEELKNKLSGYEFKILDSTQFHLGRKNGIDVSLFKNDLKGIPKIIDNKTVYSGHEKLPHEGSCSEKGILIFDNIQGADDGIAGSIDELIDTRKLFDYNLPEKWYIITVASSLEFGWCAKLINRGHSFGIK